MASRLKRVSSAGSLKHARVLNELFWGDFCRFDARAMLFAPDWQIRIGADWKTLDEMTSRFLEAGFVEASAQVVVIPGIMTAEMQDAWCNRSADADFNVDKMELAGLPVRRSAKYATSTKCEYCAGRSKRRGRRERFRRR